MKNVIRGKHRYEDRQEELAKAYRQRIYEAAIYLGVPTKGEIESAIAKPNNFGGNLSTVLNGLDFFITRGYVKTANHIARVTLDSIALAGLMAMGLDSDYAPSGLTFNAAALHHDDGKKHPEILLVSEKRLGFDFEDKQKMKRHVGVYKHTDPQVRAVIADHHRWQSNSYVPYPIFFDFILKLLALPHIERTPETIVLSKYLALLDCNDRLLTLQNSRTTNNPLQAMLREYGNLDLSYLGDKLPNVNITGKQIIDMLYDPNILGRKDPFDPYPEPYSFIRIPDSTKTAEFIAKAKLREQQISAKS